MNNFVNESEIQSVRQFLLKRTFVQTLHDALDQCDNNYTLEQKQCIVIEAIKKLWL